MGFLVALLVGGFAGYLASLVAARSSSLGILGNIVVGFLGGLLANVVLGRGDQLSNPTLEGFAFTVLGAVVLLFIVNLFTRRSIR